MGATHAAGTDKPAVARNLGMAVAGGFSFGQNVRGWRARLRGHSHSMVPGGLLVTSRTTRLISGTSLVIRLEIAASSASGSRAQSAVIASSLVTGRRTTG